MSILTNFASDNYDPGVGVEFDLFTGSRAQQTSERAILIIGTQRATGAGVATATVEKLYQAFDESDADTKWGIGSEVALMVRFVLKTCRMLNISPPEIWCVGIAEPGAGTAATGTFTFLGPATASGEAVVWIHGVEVRSAIANGDSVTTMATNLAAKINEKQNELHVSASSAVGVVTVTYRHKGTNGNDVKTEVRNGSGDRPVLPAGVTLTAGAATMAGGAGVIDITNALDKTKSLRAWQIAISNNEAADIADLKLHLDEMWATMTDMFRFAWFADTASLAAAQTLATTANDERINVITYAGARTTPGCIAACFAAMTGGREKPNCNHCNSRLPIVGPDTDSAYSPTERNTAIKSGLTAVRPLADDTSAVVRTVTSRTTKDTVTTRVLMDTQTIYTLARIAAEADAAVTLTLQERNLDESLRKDVKGVALSILRARERDGWVQNVEANKDAIKVEAHPTNDTRVLLALPSDVVKIAAQAVIKVGLVSGTV